MELRWTASLLTIPAALATNPFTRVALPKIDDKPADEIPDVCADETSHDSKQLNKMDVEKPPSTLPRRRIGSHGTKVQKHAAAYEMQKYMHICFRPLNTFNMSAF